ncbi:MAG: trypsin-like serine protease, partial [Polyangiaceae bacterium]|nr:trypsin-like serine protease [Polyangiaceae bacterium]
MFANLAGKASNHLTVFAAGCIACGSPGSGSAELGPVRTVSTTSAPIIGGVDSPSTDNAVVQVAAFKGGELTRDVASGTLVAPNLVMTARHNVAPQLQTEDRVDCRPGKTQVMFGPTVPVDDRRVFVGPESRSYSANPAGALRIKRIIVGPSLALCDSDVAFLILEQPIHDIEPASLRLFSPPSVSETVSVVGFGFSSSTGDRAAVRQRLDGLQITGY